MSMEDCGEWVEVEASRVGCRFAPVKYRSVRGNGILTVVAYFLIGPPRRFRSAGLSVGRSLVTAPGRGGTRKVLSLTRAPAGASSRKDVTYFSPCVSARLGLDLPRRPPTQIACANYSLDHICFELHDRARRGMGHQLTPVDCSTDHTGPPGLVSAMGSHASGQFFPLHDPTSGWSCPY